MSEKIATQADSIEQIRQLIMGEQLQDFQKRITKLEKSLNALNETLNQSISEQKDKIDASHTELKRYMDEFKSDFNRRLQELSSLIT